MKRIAFTLLALIFLSGCALSTIRPPKKGSAAPEPVRRPVVEREVYQPKPAPRPVVVEKEEVLTRKEKEEVLPSKEEVLPTRVTEEEIK